MGMPCITVVSTKEGRGIDTNGWTQEGSEKSKKLHWGVSAGEPDPVCDICPQGIRLVFWNVPSSGHLSDAAMSIPKTKVPFSPQIVVLYVIW